MHCIDADTLIGTLHNYGFYDGNDRTMVYKVIQLQPTIEPERKKGKWEFRSNPNIPGGMNPEDAYCSKCGFHVDVTCIDAIDEYNFCPNCGADMTEDEEE